MNQDMVIDTSELNDQDLITILDKRRQAQIETITRDLGMWLDEHHATLQAVCGFLPDGRHVTEIRIVLKS